MDELLVLVTSILSMVPQHPEVGCAYLLLTPLWACCTFADAVVRGHFNAAHNPPPLTVKLFDIFDYGFGQIEADFAHPREDAKIGRKA